MSSQNKSSAQKYANSNLNGALNKSASATGSYSNAAGSSKFTGMLVLSKVRAGSAAASVTSGDRFLCHASCPRAMHGTLAGVRGGVQRAEIVFRRLACPDPCFKVSFDLVLEYISSKSRLRRGGRLAPDLLPPCLSLQGRVPFGQTAAR